MTCQCDDISALRPLSAVMWQNHCSLIPVNTSCLRDLLSLRVDSGTQDIPQIIQLTFSSDLCQSRWKLLIISAPNIEGKHSKLFTHVNMNNKYWTLQRENPSKSQLTSPLKLNTAWIYWWNVLLENKTLHEPGKLTYLSLHQLSVNSVTHTFLYIFQKRD